jgi:hypothetical protein
LAGTYSSSADGGATTRLSQSNTGNSLSALVAIGVSPCLLSFLEAASYYPEASRGPSVKPADLIASRAKEVGELDT